MNKEFQSYVSMDLGSYEKRSLRMGLSNDTAN